jgi:hypothetical protein
VTDAEKIEAIKDIIKEAERWHKLQLLRLDMIALGTLKAVRRVAYSKEVL